METTIFESGSRESDNLTDTEWVGVSKAAELLGVHTNTIRYRIKQGHYPTRKVMTLNGEAYEIPLRVIHAALDATLRHPTTDLDHPTPVNSLAELVTQVAQQLVTPLQAEIQATAHQLERVAQELGVEKQAHYQEKAKREALEAENARLRDELKRANTPKSLWKSLFG